jgi:hypothetical protein
MVYTQSANQAKELRNEIYLYHYDTTRLIELMPTNANYTIVDAHALTLDEFRRIQNDENTPIRGIRSGQMLGKFNFFEGMKTHWKFSISGLHLVNKQIHRECLAMLYKSIAIFAQSSRRLENFLTLVTKPNLELITRLHLDHQTYGSPPVRHLEVFKQKHHIKWFKICKFTIKHLPNIGYLRINIKVLDRPLRFQFRESWVKPLLLFGRLKHLEAVKVNIFTPETEKTKIDVKDGCIWGRFYPWYVRMLVDQHSVAAKQHMLFGRAIAMKIQGFCDDCALERYKDACQRERFWVHPSNIGEHQL